MMKKFSDKVRDNKVNGGYKKYVGVAAAAVIAFGAMGTIPSMATSNETMYKIAHLLGIEKNLASYETIVGQEVTKEGIAIKINEVILNNNELLVSVTTTMDKIEKENFSAPLGRIYINGKDVNKGASGTTKIINDTTAVTLISFPLEEMPQGDIDVKVQLTTPLTNVTRSPHWNFEFKTNGDALRADTQVVEIQKTYSLKNGKEITLDRYESNEVGQKIIYSGKEGREGFIEVRGVDEKGNEIIFEAEGIFDGTGELVVTSESQSFVEEATTLTLALYENDVQVGEAFEIVK
ncbi:MAG: DUF4179 domain-containing protein [Cellulosilyticaceae bacterium]